jgi:phosphoglycerate kinase
MHLSFNKKTIRDIDLAGKKVLLRADYNVPIVSGRITDDYRIKRSLPTINYLLERNCKLIICSHLGRPNGQPNSEESLFPVAKRLKELLDRPVEFATDCVGPAAEKAAEKLGEGQVLLLENLRFHVGEEENDETFAKNLASLAEVFVQDGFGVVHRAHASTEAVTHYLPSVAGFLLEKEVDTITNVMENPKRPLAAIIGGAKIADKIELIEKFIEKADFMAIGGAMANTFLAAQGIDVADSLVSKDDFPLAKRIVRLAETESKARDFVFYLPQDVVVASAIDKRAPTRIVGFSSHTVADVENYPSRPPRIDSQIRDGERILDIGPASAAFIAGGLQMVGTAVWNGAFGVTETPAVLGPIGPTARGTETIMNALLGDFGHRPFTVVGGGDTVGYIEQRKMVDSFDHVSTGGGASLELMSGKKLPGVEALENK